MTEQISKDKEYKLSFDEFSNKCVTKPFLKSSSLVLQNLRTSSEYFKLKIPANTKFTGIFI